MRHGPRDDPERIRLALAESRRFAHRTDEDALPAPTAAGSPPPKTGSELDAYLLAGITEFWRAYRQYAGVLHFVYLTGSDPLGYTSDHFRDVEKLQLDPPFQDYLSNAFARLGVYLSFWKPTLSPSKQTLQVMLVNDDNDVAAGTLTVSLQSKSGEEAARSETPFRIAGLGQTTMYINLDVPNSPGDFILEAKADAEKASPR